MPHIRRRNESGERYTTTYLELFFDLVFVFAVTQVTELLLAHLGWEGAGQATLVLLVVWLAWQYTAWVTNELDTDTDAVRALMLALTLASLLMAIAIPEAFGAHGLLFASAYVALQVGRHAFLTFAAAEPHSLERERAGRIMTWFCAAGVLWIAGGIAHGGARTVLWLLAVAIDYGGPLATFWVPGRRQLAGQDWQLGTGHFTERFALFVIIALGESVVRTGTTTASRTLNVGVIAAFCVAFACSAALWWLYFSSIASLAERALAGARDRTLMARDAYTYGHVLVIAGIILTAVGNELVIDTPTARLNHTELITTVAGPALYLLAEGWLRLRMTGAISVRRAAGIAACVLVGLVGLAVPGIAVGALLLGVLVGVIAADRHAEERAATTPAGEPASPLTRAVH